MAGKFIYNAVLYIYIFIISVISYKIGCFKDYKVIPLS